MNAELTVYAEQIQLIKSAAAVLVGPLSVSQLAWKPEPESWSIAECFDHLNTVGFLLMPRLEESVRAGRREKVMADGPFTYGILGRWFIRALQPSAKRRRKTSVLYKPSELSEPRAVLQRFEELQGSLLELLRSADGLDLVRIRVTSPINSLFRFSLGVWFAATVAHEQRHLAQAERVRGTDGFPSA